MREEKQPRLEKETFQQMIVTHAPHPLRECSPIRNQYAEYPSSIINPDAPRHRKIFRPNIYYGIYSLGPSKLKIKKESSEESEHVTRCESFSISCTESLLIPRGKKALVKSGGWSCE